MSISVAGPPSGSWRIEELSVGSKEAANAASKPVTKIVMRLLQAAQYTAEVEVLDSPLYRLSGQRATCISYHVLKRKEAIEKYHRTLGSLLLKVDVNAQSFLRPQWERLRPSLTDSESPLPLPPPSPELSDLFSKMVTFAQRMGTLQGRQCILRSKMDAQGPTTREADFVEISTLAQRVKDLTEELSLIKSLVISVDRAINPVFSYALRVMETIFQTDSDIRVLKIPVNITVDGEEKGGMLKKNIGRQLSLKSRVLQLISYANFTKLLEQLDHQISFLDSPAQAEAPRLLEQEASVVLARIERLFCSIFTKVGNGELTLLPVDLLILERRRQAVVEKQKKLQEAGSLDCAIAFRVLPFVYCERYFSFAFYLEHLLSKLQKSRAVSDQERATYQAEIDGWIIRLMSEEEYAEYLKSLDEVNTKFRSSVTSPAFPFLFYVERLLAYVYNDPYMTPLSIEDLTLVARGSIPSYMEYQIAHNLHIEVEQIAKRPPAEQKALLIAAFNLAKSKGLSTELQNDIFREAREFVRPQDSSLSVDNIIAYLETNVFDHTICLLEAIQKVVNERYEFM